MFQNFGSTFGYANFGEPVIRRGFNRTGATIVQGQVAILDFLQTQAETTTLEGASSTIQANLGPVTQATTDAGFPVWVCQSVSIADNAEGDWVVYGYCDVASLDDDASPTANIDKGDPICITTAKAVSSSGTAAALTTGGGTCDTITTVTERSCGIWLEDAAASSSSTDRLIDAGAHRRRAFWTAGVPMFDRKRA